jgi:hypothetical protein
MEVFAVALTATGCVRSAALRLHGCRRGADEDSIVARKVPLFDEAALPRLGPICVWSPRAPDVSRQRRIFTELGTSGRVRRDTAGVVLTPTTSRSGDE